MNNKYLKYEIDDNYVKHFDTKPQDLSKEELQQAIRSMAKRANQRLRILENGGYTNLNAYRKVLSNSEKMSIFDYTKSGEIKFSTATSKKSYNQLQQEFSELQKFLTAKTSTITGIKNKYERARNTLNERYNTDLTTEQIGELFESNVIQKTSNRFGSDKVLSIISRYNISNLKTSDIIDLFESNSRENQSFNDLINRFNNQKDKIESLREKFRKNV